MFKKKKIRRGGVGIKGSALYRADGSATGKALNTLDEALAANTECGCGIRCDLCYSYMTLFSFNSTTGEMELMALYVVDGVMKIDTVENAKAEQEAILSI